ncbi:16S rRNA (guanine1207-N2)-methyltransferase [Mariprofundus micogutta]|uniref:16S rRNA (Guanine1207-N2)-methyltransferase n=1 Tax=Mariprofundus micogutta TaxID=1921010 RepID=A0A1L8CQ85_9PROT|nr:methyltransferase [Mariprofundus micogutta]GAV20989.1 16S rRNA (guanine1207-N2)-methyltransferase [Mariprofundus micogutta]
MSAVELLYQAALKTPATKMLVINAHAHPLLAELNKQTERLDLRQHFKPENDAIKYMGLNVSPELPVSDQAFDLVLMLPAKNKQQTLGWMATAMKILADHGKLLIACANNHGAKSYESSLKKLAGNVSSSSKSKCRIFSARKTDSLNFEWMTQWMEAGQPRKIELPGLISQPGLFSWDRADIGSLLLLEQLPKLTGTGMDLCSGYGLLGKQILAGSPGIQTLHMIEADFLAVECARTNTAKWRDKVQLQWSDATKDELPTQLDWIVCNPPFHTGQTRDVDLGQTIIKRACKSLKKGGTIYLVANRQLPYEHVLESELHEGQKLIEANGFKVIKGIR